MADLKYTVVGMMSGTSLDGMDLILCSFLKKNRKWEFTIEKAVTFAYSAEWKSRLTRAAELKAEEFMILHLDYGNHIGDRVKSFLSENGLTAGLVASHGHTIFHQPARGLTFQLGEGASIASRCDITTISDFRTLDVALGGQGAPLVPVGDELLFSEFRYCLNLGGFANISHSLNGIRIACDICPVNIVLNSLAQRRGMDFDAGGEFGRQGIPCEPLVNELNNLGYYSLPGPKSLGREWVESQYMPVLDKYVDILPENLACSIYEHIVFQLGRYLQKFGPGEILVTGGGTFNTYLVEKISMLKGISLVIPDEQIVKFKEALIFAFLGVLRYRDEINCLSSVTGARRDSSSGIIHRGG